ncbi:MAG: OmpA family protein [Candidatus Eisenbacteria bacterium]|nr:OmpA family protein [Candidatus Eisenbacteria bacterium]
MQALEIMAIRDDLRARLGGDWSHDSGGEDLDRIVVDEFGGEALSFATGQADLPLDAQERLRAFAVVLNDVVGAHPACRVVLSGKADPRAMWMPSHPRDNLELSALRAASVASIFRQAAPVTVSGLHVVGLGEVGTQAPGKLTAGERDEYYRRYRTVSVEIRVNVVELGEHGAQSQ